jgi:hypothetical protein
MKNTVRQIQIKTIMDYYLIPIAMAILKNNKHQLLYGEMEPL